MAILQLSLSRFRIAVMLLTLFVLSPGQSFLFAHGDEDHSKDNQTSKTTAGSANEPVIVLHTARLGTFEVLVKHPAITPDTATDARLFVSDFSSNAPAGNVSAGVEIESANGTVTRVSAENASTAGTFNFRIPPLPAGTYILRAKVTSGGNTDTATFSNLQIQAPAANEDLGGVASWLRSALIAILSLAVVGLFGCLIYFVLRSVKDETSAGETVSA